MNEDIKSAMDAVEREDYDEAFRIFRPLAENGNALAQSNLGTLYQLGLGVGRDLVEAIKWLKLAVDKGDGSAAHNLGTIYLSGSPQIPLNPAESKKWYRKARELGFEVAEPAWYE